MRNLNYIYEKIVAAGALEDLLCAPSSHNSLQDRVAKVLRYLLPLNEEHIPEDLRAELRTIRSVCDHPIKPTVRWPLDTQGQRIQSLTPNEAKKILRAFLTITVEVIKRLDGNSRWRRIKHNSVETSAPDGALKGRLARTKTRQRQGGACDDNGME